MGYNPAASGSREEQVVLFSSNEEPYSQRYDTFLPILKNAFLHAEKYSRQYGKKNLVSNQCSFRCEVLRRVQYGENIALVGRIDMEGILEMGLHVCDISHNRSRCSEEAFASARVEQSGSNSNKSRMRIQRIVAVFVTNFI